MPIVAFAALLAWCVVLSVIDFRWRRLPNPLTAAGAAAVFGYALCTGRCTAALLGAALLAVPYLLVHLMLPRSFGAGDVKLAVGLGAAAALGGGQVWVRAALAAPLCTALAALVLLGLCRIRAPADGVRSDHRTAIPHGPAMCLATVCALATARVG
ncbi:leader peptidase (prepilin peptidase)/N-methyltransferase [Nocardia tenerifensis]|uniref:Leader peptidase (Prepilin peptidase)/N-methyltransferase n=1 Tax=Nocardia tenerifensis TaxID=228006 RepID=A0A318JWL4_9NOCA|nr:A24 family peptidase [Nocardia tenerifensis]PXX57859.1 leader peptidase (prepilin peptidase)/N-methyltransferase [Nocardia tenerifensis]